MVSPSCSVDSRQVVIIGRQPRRPELCQGNVHLVRSAFYAPKRRARPSARFRREEWRLRRAQTRLAYRRWPRWAARAVLQQCQAVQDARAFHFFKIVLYNDHINIAAVSCLTTCVISILTCLFNMNAHLFQKYALSLYDVFNLVSCCTYTTSSLFFSRYFPCNIFVILLLYLFDFILITHNNVGVIELPDKVSLFLCKA